jgi:iron only hydrogenase large subunit-like protein
MSAILSADDLNDFISPGVACIKPIEAVPAAPNNPYEVTTEDKVAAAAPAQISLTDCLACSGCVTSAEAVLVSLQSHTEVLSALDKSPSMRLDDTWTGQDGMIFVASVSPQARASLAAAYGISEREAGNMISQLLSSKDGIASGGVHGSSFAWVVDTNVIRQMALVSAAEEVADLLEDSTRQPAGDGVLITDKPKKPILASVCPGWICYVEKTFPHILPHLSRLKSPQALTGTLLKSALYKTKGIHPSKVWHLAIMPCFDKKLEASRSELTSDIWIDESSEPVRDVDCVITARELLQLAESRGITFGKLSKAPLSSHIPFPDAKLDGFLFGSRNGERVSNEDAAGTSGGYLWHTLRRLQNRHAGSQIAVSRGRNADVVEYSLNDSSGKPLVKLARYYGFRNIQNLVRRLKPKRTNRLLLAGDRSGARKPNGTSVTEGLEYAYVEVMACPGGCTNGGGQMRVEDVVETLGEAAAPLNKKEWLKTVDEKYWDSDSDQGSDDSEQSATNDHHDLLEDVVDGISRTRILDMINYWSSLVGVDKQELLCTSFRKVESDVGKKKTSDVDRVAALAGSIGGGW